MKLKYIFEYIKMGEEIIAIPISSSDDSLHGIIKLNQEGEEIFKLLEKDTTKEEIIDTLSLKYENNRTVLSEYVTHYLEKLRVQEILEE